MSIPSYAVAYSIDKEGKYVIHVVIGDEHPTIEGELQRFYLCNNPAELNLAIQDLYLEQKTWGINDVNNEIYATSRTH